MEMWGLIHFIMSWACSLGLGTDAACVMVSVSFASWSCGILVENPPRQVWDSWEMWDEDVEWMATTQSIEITF